MDDIVKLIDGGDADNVFVLKGRAQICEHQWEIDLETRSISCSKCGQESTAWDVLVRIAHNEGTERKRLAHARRETAELKRWNPHLRAVRELERIWRGKMLPTCPNCGMGVAAVDLANGCQVHKEHRAIAKNRMYPVRADHGTD